MCDKNLQCGKVRINAQSYLCKEKKYIIETFRILKCKAKIVYIFFFEFTWVMWNN